MVLAFHNAYPFINFLTPKICDSILGTLKKMQPHHSQSSSENAAPSSSTYPISLLLGSTPSPWKHLQWWGAMRGSFIFAGYLWSPSKAQSVLISFAVIPLTLHPSQSFKNRLILTYKIHYFSEHNFSFRSTTLWFLRFCLFCEETLCNISPVVSFRFPRHWLFYFKPINNRWTWGVKPLDKPSQTHRMFMYVIILTQSGRF